MASIKSFPFSFVRFEDLSEAYCPGEAQYVLPAGLKHEVKFQFLVDGYLAIGEKIKLGTNGSPFAPAVYAELLDYKYKVDYQVDLQYPFYVYSVVFGELSVTYNRVFTAEEFLQALLDDFGIEAHFEETYIVFAHKCNQCFKVYTMQDDEDLTWYSEERFWNQGYVAAPNIDITDECFFYSLLKEDNVADVLMGNSNMFKKSRDCFSSLITYSCDENQFGFYYSGGQVNQVRLPFYLSRPNYPQKKEVYINSKGRHKITSAMVEKEYLLQADWMIELFHECMSIALSHDTIIIANSNIREKIVEVISSDGYLADWNNEFELLTAPGKGKVKVAAFGYTNSNCDTEDDDECQTTCNKVVEITLVYYEDGFFHFAFTCTNNVFDTDFIIEWSSDGVNWTAVPWDFIEPEQGIVDAAANGIPFDEVVQFRITPKCCDISGTPGTIEYEPEGGCIKIEFDGDEPDFPDAEVGVPYNFSFDVTGTPPFTFVPESDIVDPISPDFWLTVSIVGHTVTLSGTPGAGDAGDDIALAFSIENCGGNDNFINVNQTINVS